MPTVYATRCFRCCDFFVRLNIAACGISSGDRKQVVQIRTRPIFCGWRARLANQRKVERGQLTPRRSHKMADSNVFFSRVHLLHKVQTKCDDSEEIQVILALGARVRHHTGHHFIYPAEVRKHWALCPQKPLRLIRDGEVGGLGFF